MQLDPASSQRPGSDSIDSDSKFRQLRPVEERVAGVRQNMAFNFRSCCDELGGESLTRSTHGVSVSIDHDGGREPPKVVSAGEGGPLGKSKL